MSASDSRALARPLSPQAPLPGQYELATVSAAAHSKALVEAKFTIALHQPRSLLDARARILDACRRPAFAERAWYAKPVGNSKVRGPSIRFAEEALRAMTNITTIVNIVHDDERKQLLHIEIIDLESNTSYADTVAINKTVERRSTTDRVVIDERTNTRGEKIYVVLATEDELLNKINAAKSKVIRNNGLRLIPQDLIDEAEAVIEQTRAGDIAKDPKEAARKIADSFGSIGVSPLMLEQFLGHALQASSPGEIATLREAFSAIKEGESSWQSFVEAKHADQIPMGDEPAKPQPKPGNGRLFDREPPPPAAAPAPAPTTAAPAPAQPKPAPAPASELTLEQEQPRTPKPPRSAPAAPAARLEPAAPKPAPAPAEPPTQPTNPMEESARDRLERRITDFKLDRFKVETWLAEQSLPTYDELEEHDCATVLKFFSHLASFAAITK